MNYAHNDTSTGERKSVTAQFNKPNLPPYLSALRRSAFERSIPTADDETLNYLLTLVSSINPKNILELGTATGISALAMHSACPNAHITTIEKNADFFREAQNNIQSLNAQRYILAIEGDAGEVMATLDDKYDFIFMDCAKVQYIKYLPTLKKLLKKGGTLLADDILLFGWVTGESEVPQKRKMLARHIGEYVQAVINDSELQTTIINVGDGLAMSVKL